MGQHTNATLSSFIRLSCGFGCECVLKFKWVTRTQARTPSLNVPSRKHKTIPPLSSTPFQPRHSWRWNISAALITVVVVDVVVFADSSKIYSSSLLSNMLDQLVYSRSYSNPNHVLICSIITVEHASRRCELPLFVLSIFSVDISFDRMHAAWGMPIHGAFALIDWLIAWSIIIFILRCQWKSVEFDGNVRGARHWVKWLIEYQ